MDEPVKHRLVSLQMTAMRRRKFTISEAKAAKARMQDTVPGMDLPQDSGAMAAAARTQGMVPGTALPQDSGAMAARAMEAERAVLSLPAAAARRSLSARPCAFCRIKLSFEWR